MGYWFFMLAMNLLLPAIMIISGGYFMKKAPKEINYVFGYNAIHYCLLCGDVLDGIR